MRRELTFKNMIEVYLNARENMDQVYETYCVMNYYGFISNDLFFEFQLETMGWVYEKDTDRVISNQSGKILKDFTDITTRVFGCSEYEAAILKDEESIKAWQSFRKAMQEE